MPPSPQQTAIRRAVADLDHPSADEVFLEARRTLPRVSLSTVYRNLDQLVADGQMRVRIVGGIKRYDTRLERHAHLHCRHCDRLLDIDFDAAGTGPLHEAAQAAGFHITDQTIELVGTCATCAKNGVKP